MAVDELAYLDEHAVDVEADARTTWQAVLDVFGGMAAAWPVAKVLGCDPARVERWDDPAVGSSIPGFRAVELDPPHRLVIEGRHRFSRYAIVVRIEERGSGTRCRLESRADFPGPHGRLYRLAVVGSRGHVVAVRRLLRSIRRTAESG